MKKNFTIFNVALAIATTLVSSNTINSQTQACSVGPGNITAFGTNGGYSSNPTGMAFEVSKTLILESITVFTGTNTTAGSRVISIVDASNTTDVTKWGVGGWPSIDGTYQNLPSNSKATYTIGFTCQPGIKYGLTTVSEGLQASTGITVKNDLYRHISGATYPVKSADGSVTITGDPSPNKRNSWYIAYSWTFSDPKGGCISVGVNEMENSKNLSVYPNPTNGIFNIKSSNESEEKATVKVYNLMGQEVFSEATTLGNNKTFSIDLTNNEKGIYTVRLISEQGSQSIQKIVIN